jgi:GTP-binding protein YchF
VEKDAKRGSKEAAAELALCEKLIPHLDNGLPALTCELSDDERKLMKSFFLLSSKPVIYACNVAEAELAAASLQPETHAFVSNVRKHVATMHSASAVVISAAIENELVDLPDEDAKAYLADLGVKDSGVSQLIKAVYDLLGLQTYLTTGEKETRAWTITKGMKAPQAAGVIHSDFERGFIAAQIANFEDLVALGSEAKCREAGKLKIEGKEYVMRDGDVVEWRFNV